MSRFIKGEGSAAGMQLAARYLFMLDVGAAVRHQLLDGVNDHLAAPAHRAASLPTPLRFPSDGPNAGHVRCA